MAAAVKNIKIRNAKRAEEEAIEMELRKKKEAAMIAKMGTAKARPRGASMTDDEKSMVALEKAYRIKEERRRWPKVKGYGRISPHCGRLLPFQAAVCKFYQNPWITWGVASVIIGNFLGIIIEKEIDPYPDNLKQHKFAWMVIDVASNLIFLVELIINYYGAGTRRFWTSAWNVFDFIVVLVGCLVMLQVPLGPFSMLKIFRAFRVFRLFKRIESLNKIIVALINAIPGVLNAFVIMIIFMAIYAILAVDYFRDFGGNYTHPEYVTQQGNTVEGTAGNTTVSSISARGFTLGDEYYGNFGRAFYTLFQVLTGESWSEAIARPLIFGYSPYNAAFVGFFFSSFILLMQIVLINVVVAVLLDKFVSEPEAEGGADSESDEEDNGTDADGKDVLPVSEPKAPKPYTVTPVLVSTPTKPAAPPPTEDSDRSAISMLPFKALAIGEKMRGKADGAIRDRQAATVKKERDEEAEVLRLQESVAGLHGKLDLIMKALEQDGKEFVSGSTGCSSGSTLDVRQVAAPAPALGAAPVPLDSK